jgi:hypothetical protein
MRGSTLKKLINFIVKPHELGFRARPKSHSFVEFAFSRRAACQFRSQKA